MTDDLALLFAKNRQWAADILEQNPAFFTNLAALQSPDYLWIGCSDSRVPANQICGLLPGEVFVHRNVANVVVHSDLNCLSVIQFAVEVLRVKHIMVVGHYQCGGVHAALEDRKLGLIDNWLRHIQDVRDRHADLLEGLNDHDRLARLCELNVIAQVVNVAQTTILREAWQKHQDITLHGWIYGLGDGLLRDLEMTINSPAEVASTLEKTLGRLSTEQSPGKP